MKPSVSVIIPVYNEERTVASVVEIMRTWGKASEIIVVNDGSTDDTLGALRQFRNITIISRKHNRGKGYSLAEGIRASQGELLMFFDGDVIGLTHKDLDRMVRPVISGRADMVIAATNCSSIGPLAPFDDINGERVLWRKNIIGHLDKFHTVGNGVEFVINDLHKRKRVRTIQLPHVFLLSKFEKVPATEAILQYIKEAKQFVTAILQIQSDSVTPQAKRLLRASQDYLRRALDYFQP